MPSKYEYFFIIPKEAVDVNGHANNVMYIQWMQDAAVKHHDAYGGADICAREGATWVVRAHTVEYLKPAYEGAELLVMTCVADIEHVKSKRKYEFRRASDHQLLVRGETQWEFVDAATGSPKALPDEMKRMFEGEE